MADSVDPLMPRGHGHLGSRSSARYSLHPEILRHRSAWFTAFRLFCGNYYWYF